MKYSKPKVVAQNKKNGSFAAGCPSNIRGGSMCLNCERTK